MINNNDYNNNNDNNKNIYFKTQTKDQTFAIFSAMTTPSHVDGSAGLHEMRHQIWTCGTLNKTNLFVIQIACTSHINTNTRLRDVINIQATKYKCLIANCWCPGFGWLSRLWKRQRAAVKFFSDFLKLAAVICAAVLLPLKL